jgi:hypothetical protein
VNLEIMALILPNVQNLHSFEIRPTDTGIIGALALGRRTCSCSVPLQSRRRTYTITPATANPDPIMIVPIQNAYTTIASDEYQTRDMRFAWMNNPNP